MVVIVSVIEAWSSLKGDFGNKYQRCVLKVNSALHLLYLRIVECN